MTKRIVQEKRLMIYFVTNVLATVYFLLNVELFAENKPTIPMQADISTLNLIFCSPDHIENPF